MARGSSSGVRVTGLRETIRSLERFGVAVSDLKGAFRKVGTLVVNEARVLAPVRTGTLAGTIRAGNAKNRAIVRAGTARAPYAGYVHYGSVHNPEPVPFLESAAEREQAASVRVLESELRGLIRRYDLR